MIANIQSWAQNIYFVTHYCYSLPLLVTCYPLLVTLTLVLESTSNDVTSNDLDLYITFKVTCYNPAETVSDNNK
jgi:hypothetical protein